MKLLAKMAAGVVVVVSLLGGVFLVGMRRKSPPVVDAVRKLNKQVLNPQQMETAGMPGAFAGVIEHVGRKSGEKYRTPVGVTETDVGFAVMLPYGRRADWLKNVLAAGSATIVHEGETHAVTDPMVVPVDSVASLSTDDERLARVFGVTECLTVRRLTPSC